MSTYWHLECVSHDPPLSSDGEISQHTDWNLDVARQLWANRDAIAAVWPVLSDFATFDNHFHANAWWFIQQHRGCHVQLRNEYGAVERIEKEPSG